MRRHETHSKVAFFLALAGGLFSTLSVARAEEAPATRVFTLEEAITVAMDRNRDVQKAVEYRNWVKGKYVEERAAALPQLSLQGGYTQQSDTSMIDLYGPYAEIFPFSQGLLQGQVNLTQALFTWGQVGAAIRAAKMGMKTAEDQLRLFRQAAQRDVSVAFYDVLLAKEVLNITREDLQQKERHLSEAQTKYGLGTATDYDVLSAEVLTQNARPAVIRSENAILTARERLRFLLADPAPSVDASGTLEGEFSPSPTYEAAFETALKNRPELHDLDHQIEISKELEKIARAGDKPRLDLMAGYGLAMYWVDDAESDGQFWNAGVFLTFPFFDGLRTRGRVAEARSDRTRLEIESAKVRDSVAMELRLALDSEVEALAILKALAGTVAEAERLVTMAEKGFEFGVKTHLEVEDALQNLRMARGNLARAQRDYIVSRVNLLWVMGVLGEKPDPGAASTVHPPSPEHGQ